VCEYYYMYSKFVFRVILSFEHVVLDWALATLWTIKPRIKTTS
jgi:hypothetical protein